MTFRKMIATRPWGDLALAVVAAAFGWASLTYPFGRDLGLYFYVGREWALRGAIPYRDVLDHKTPGIYLVHALVVLVFGETLWGIRIADLGSVVALGWVAGHFVAKERGVDGVPLRGFGALVASVFFFGFLDFKATSEAEVWMTLPIVGALVVALGRRRRPGVRTRGVAGPGRLFLIGVLSGVALLMKPLAAVLLLVVLAPILARARRDPATTLQRLSLVGLGAATAIAPVLLYFFAHDALRPLYELVVQANGLYVREGSPIKRPIDLPLQTKLFFDWYRPFSSVLGGATALAFVSAIARKRRSRARSLALRISLVGAGWIAVCLQAKFYQGHWGVMLAGTTIVAVGLVADVARAAPSKVARWCVPIAVVLLAIGFASSGPRVSEYVDVNRAAYMWVAGKSSRATFTDHFQEFFNNGRVRDNEDVAAWLREHTTEDDYVAVRGFQPQVYALARRRYPGRLFWTTFVLGPAGAKYGSEWIEADRRVLAAHPPKYACAYDTVHQTIESVEWWTARGYTVRTKVGDYIILEHTPETATERW